MTWSVRRRYLISNWKSHCFESDANFPLDFFPGNGNVCTNLMLRIKISSVAKILIKISLIKKMLIALLSSLLAAVWFHHGAPSQHLLESRKLPVPQPHVGEEKENQDFCICEILHQCSQYKIAQCGPSWIVRGWFIPQVLFPFWLLMIAYQVSFLIELPPCIQAGTMHYYICKYKRWCRWVFLMKREAVDFLLHNGWCWGPDLFFSKWLHAYFPICHSFLAWAPQ